MTSKGYLTSADIWHVLASHMRDGQWRDVQQIYSLVSNNATITERDEDPDAPGSNSVRWQRNVRNVLQRRKTSGDLEWDPAAARYRLL